MRMSSIWAPSSSAMTCAKVVSSPWPCEAIPKQPVTALVESRRIVTASVPVLIGMPGGCRDPRPDAGQLRIGGDADADQPTRGAGFCLLVPKLRVSCGGAGAGQGFREAGTVPDDSGRG